MSTERIRELNDALRKTGTGGKLKLTSNVASLPELTIARVMTEVQTFTDFNPDNDPHGEHDMAFFEVGERAFFFKIGYFNPTMEGRSEDPADPSKTVRVLTIGLIGDY